jgi:hypothetical protein
MILIESPGLIIMAIVSESSQCHPSMIGASKITGPRSPSRICMSFFLGRKNTQSVLPFNFPP